MGDEFSLQFETRKFQRWTQSLIEDAEDEVASKALRKLAFDFTNKVIKRTPVDTGRARAGWTGWVNKQPEYTVQLNAGAGGSIDSQAVQEGRSKSRFEENLSGPRQHITIINAVEYILALEFGHSAQAPQGFMRITMRELQRGEQVTVEWLRRLNKAIAQADRTAFKGGALPG